MKMRLDVFLRNSGLVPRRPLAKRACDSGLITIDGRPAKASSEVKVGQLVTVGLGSRVTTHRVLAIPPRPVSKAERDKYTELVSVQTRDEQII